MKKTLSERIDELLALRQINQTQLAELAGITRSAITNIKSGRNKGFSAETALIICKKLSINPYWLIFGEGSPELTNIGSNDGESAKNLINNMTLPKRQFAIKFLKELDSGI